MLNIIQDFIPQGKINRSGIKMDPKYITIHNTGNPNKGANAEMHSKYLKNVGKEVSWHFSVDDYSVYQHLPLDEVGWHAGDGHGNGNMKSIAIEICENSDGNLQKAEENAIQLIRHLMSEYNISIGNVVPHKHWSFKNCPHLILPRWDEFIESIKSIEFIKEKDILDYTLRELLDVPLKDILKAL